MGVILAIDAGTSMVKAVAFDRDGCQLTTARRRTQVSRPRPEWSEQDMDEVWDCTRDLIRECAATHQIDVVAVTGQGDGCWLIDEHGRPTGPAILWNDGRAADLVEQWRRSGVVEAGSRANGCTTFPGLANAVLRWLDEHEPGRLDRSATMLSCSSWLYFCLTGRVELDASEAAAPFGDLHNGGYSAALLDLYGLSHRVDLLPPVANASDPVASVPPEVAGDLGLRPDTRVVLAPYDVAATAIGAGVVQPGQAIAVLGTTLFAGVVHDEPAVSAAAGLMVPLGVDGRWLSLFPTLVGVEGLSWGARLTGADDEVAFIALAGSSQPGARGVTALPYLSSAGERSPFLEPAARGMLLGLSLHHTPADVAMAVLEGLSMVVRDCLEASRAEVDELHLGGGGANSDVWCQQIADVVGTPAVRLEFDELGARGAAAVAATRTSRPDVLLGFLGDSSGRRFAPDHDRHAAYDFAFARFLSLRRQAAAIWSVEDTPQPAGSGGMGRRS